jgi:hypothetical protein
MLTRMHSFIAGKMGQPFIPENSLVIPFKTKCGFIIALHMNSWAFVPDK